MIEKFSSFSVENHTRIDLLLCSLFLLCFFFLVILEASARGPMDFQLYDMQICWLTREWCSENVRKVCQTLTLSYFSIIFSSIGVLFPFFMKHRATFYIHNYTFSFSLLTVHQKKRLHLHDLSCAVLKIHFPLPLLQWTEVPLGLWF